VLTPTHIAAGYIVSEILIRNSNLQGVNNPLITELTILGSLVPDIDGLFGKQLKDHRKTVFHAPLFWLLVMSTICLIIYFYTNKQGLIYYLAFSFGVLSHLFLDWFSGRTAGIRIFYPFSKKQYSLFTLDPTKGAVGVFPNKKNFHKYLVYVRFFCKNKFLVLAEIIIILTAVLFWIKYVD
jgi:membrane-bound metal-dependent hydrolase YbcI (DUF457 family)